MSRKTRFGLSLSSIVLTVLLLAMHDAQGQVGITVVTQPATSIVTTGATLNGTVDGNGGDVSAVYFDYGPTLAYDHVFSNAVPFNVTAAQGQTPVSLVVGGLACGTTYHFRVTADDANGRNAKGEDRTFATAPCIAPESKPIPTLSHWSLLALAGLIGMVAWWHRRPRRAG
jgi:hypothetical protein